MSTNQSIEVKVKKVRFNQTLENYLRVSVGSDTHILKKNDKMQITDTTKIIFPI